MMDFIAIGIIVLVVVAVIAWIAHKDETSRKW
jgi:hypothetical protein